MLYAITDRRQYGGDEASARARLLELVGVWAAEGVAWIQLREKDLAARELVGLAREVLRVMRTEKEARAGDEGQRGADAPRGENAVGPRLLINGRVDVALAAGADGVHLPGGEDGLTPDEVRKIFAAAGRVQTPFVSVSCHAIEEVEAARRQQADCILFAPVFGKEIAGVAASAAEKRRMILPGAGLKLLHQACAAAAPVPVFALGGVTAENAAECMRAGAAGIAAIRLLQKDASVWGKFA
jgi:thiamine-phosphate pyrophosphorylase